MWSRRALLSAVAVASIGVLLATSCGGGSSQAAAAEPTATLGIISTNIDTATSANAFTPAKEGQALAVGDQVRTDPTGFAEITYHDGSWTRIEHNATLTIDELTDTGTAKTVKASIDTGDAWNRARHLTSPDDAYQLDTPVATAAVRGTAFATTCTTNPTRCTFSVLDGTVEITPHTGTPLTLHAGDTVTITADQPPPTPTSPGIAALAQDPFIADNLTRDHTTNPDLAPTTDDLRAALDLSPIFDGTFESIASLGTPDVLACLQANTDLTTRIAQAHTERPITFSPIEPDAFYVYEAVIGCAGKDAVIHSWQAIANTGVNGCFADALAGRSDAEVAAILSDQDPEGVVGGDPYGVYTDIFNGCLSGPATSPSTSGGPVSGGNGAGGGAPSPAPSGGATADIG